MNRTRYAYGSGGVAAAAQVYPLLSTTPSANPSSIGVSAANLADGWVDIEINRTVTTGLVPSEAVAYDLGPTRDAFGSAVSPESGTWDLNLEIDSAGIPVGMYVWLLIAPDVSFGSNDHVGTRLQGVTVAPLTSARLARADLDDVPQVLNSPGVKFVLKNIPLSMDRSRVRGSAYLALDAANNHVDVGASFSTAPVIPLTGARLWLLAGHTGASSGTATARVRASFFAIPDDARLP